MVFMDICWPSFPVKVYGSTEHLPDEPGSRFQSGWNGFPCSTAKPAERKRSRNFQADDLSMGILVLAVASLPSSSMQVTTISTYFAP